MPRTKRKRQRIRREHCPPVPLAPRPSPLAPASVLFEDPHLLVLNKPAPLLTQAPPGVPSLESMAKAYIKAKYAKPAGVYLGIPPRLDFTREAALFKSPVWTVPGNHENFGVERARSKVSATHPLYGRKMYRHYRGPDYYSFNFGGVHFVGLNTVDIDDQWNYGHVDSAQHSWLGRDLATVPSAMPVVTFNHIPFFTSIEAMHGYTDEPPAPTLITVNGKTAFRHTVSNAGDVLAVLRARRHVLALGGHIHTGEQITYDMDAEKIRFNQAPAIVGPSGGAGMRFTSGFMLYTVRNGVIDDGRFVPLGIDK
mgnify:CR=1 FL=1